MSFAKGPSSKQKVIQETVEDSEMVFNMENLLTGVIIIAAIVLSTGCIILSVLITCRCAGKLLNSRVRRTYVAGTVNPEKENTMT